jgi:hypothetical protein
MIQNIFALRHASGLVMKNGAVELQAFDLNDLVFKLED